MGSMFPSIPGVKQRNNDILETNIELWSKNAAENLTVHKRIGRGILELEGVLRDKPLLLLGPGPSLDLARPYLGPFTVGQLATVACNTALNPLAAFGFIPDFVVAYDAKPEVADQVEQFVDWCPKEMIQGSRLICPVTIDPRVPKSWPGIVYWFLPHDPTTPESATFHKVLEHQFKPQRGEYALIGNASNVFGLMLTFINYFKCSLGMSVGFELPIDPRDSYGAVRYDLSRPDKGPIPLAKHHKQMNARYATLHQRYVAFILSRISDKAIPYVNLSPLASFRDFVETHPVSVIATGVEGIMEGRKSGE